MVFWGLILLTIVNVSALTTIWLQQQRTPPRPSSTFERLRRANQFFKEELGLTEQQANQFLDLGQLHGTEVHAIRDSIHILKEELFSELSVSSPDTSKMENIAEKIGAYQIQLERLLYQHFFELQSVCNEKQKEKLASIFSEHFKRIRRSGKPERDRR